MTFRKYARAIECFLLFGLLPGGLIYWQHALGVPFFPVLFALLGLTLLITLVDPSIKWRAGKPAASSRLFLPILLRRVLLAFISLSLLTLLFFPDLFLRLPRERPQLWLLIMCAYPLLSVAPQEFLFRTFFMQRYRLLFGDGTAMLWMNALAFAWAHAFFLNWIAPLLSLIAGLLLAHTWQRTRSFRMVCLEHALYGQIVFTCGIGWFFYQGSSASLQTLVP